MSSPWAPQGRQWKGEGGRLGWRRNLVAALDGGGLRLPRISGGKSPAPHFNARLPVSNTVKEGTTTTKQWNSEVGGLGWEF